MLQTDFATIHDRAMGALLGACIGDASGGVLEFLGRAPTPREVDAALAMPGGGVLSLSPGQITDDGELSLSLARALAKSSMFDLDAIARAYYSWYSSDPIDMGGTTGTAFGSVDQARSGDASQPGASISSIMQAAASTYAAGSKANGSLMRATPLAIWRYRDSDETLAAFARLDASLSHPNPSCGARAHATSSRWPS